MVQSVTKKKNEKNNFMKNFIFMAEEQMNIKSEIF